MSVYSAQRRRFLFLCLAFASAIFILISYSQLPRNILSIFYPKDNIYCYRSKLDSLPDISTVNPSRGKSIFFHETSCNSFDNGKITILARQACAVESAAKMNPDMEVYLLFASPGVIRLDSADESDRLLQAVLSYHNVHVLHLDYEKYTEGTPVERLYKDGIVEGSDYSQSHASDVLRYLTLWKYGGIYLDLDVIVVKPFGTLAPNYAGAESDENVAAGVLSFSPTGKGHEFASACLDDLKNNFNGHDWGNNGPGVITRLLKRICGAGKAKDMLNKDCDGFTVYSRDYFYFIPWQNWRLFFNETASENVVTNITKLSYVAHVWNKHSINTKIDKDSKGAYIELARRFCPKVVKECREVF